MITIFFIFSALLLYLERKKLLYKILPILLLITIFVPRGDIEPDWVMNLDYMGRYIAYLKYVLMGFVHFSSCYVLGMYFSKYENAIDKFYNHRYLLIFLMILVSALDIFIGIKYNIMNGTASKLLLTVIALAYLKHYDEKIKSMTTLNKFLDITAKYSFGLFFVHWYYVFFFNYVFHLSPSIPVNGFFDGIVVFLISFLRLLSVFALSFITLYLIKKGLGKLGIKNTRTYTGV